MGKYINKISIFENLHSGVAACIDLLICFIVGVSTPPSEWFEVIESQEQVVFSKLRTSITASEQVLPKKFFGLDSDFFFGVKLQIMC